jgi:hypothetical protein
MAPQGIASLNLTKILFLCSFHNNLLDTLGTKMADPILESSLKTRLDTI